MTAPWIQRCFFLIITTTITTAGTRDCVDARQISTEAISCASVCVCCFFFLLLFFTRILNAATGGNYLGIRCSLSLSLSPRPSFIKSDPRVKDGARRLRDSSEREMVWMEGRGLQLLLTRSFLWKRQAAVSVTFPHRTHTSSILPVRNILNYLHDPARGDNNARGWVPCSGVDVLCNVSLGMHSTLNYFNWAIDAFRCNQRRSTRNILIGDTKIPILRCADSSVLFGKGWIMIQCVPWIFFLCHSHGAWKQCGLCKTEVAYCIHTYEWSLCVRKSRRLVASDLFWIVNSVGCVHKAELRRRLAVKRKLRVSQTWFDEGGLCFLLQFLLLECEDGCSAASACIFHERLNLC